MYEASAEHRKRTTPATSSGWASRPIGIRASCQAIPSAVLTDSRVISVATVPGATALTLMPCGASSAASDVVIWRTAPLLVSYATPGRDEATKAEVDAKLTILPERCGTMRRAAACEQRKT